MNRRDAKRVLSRIWEFIHANEQGLTTLEYVIAAAIILVVLSAAILAWNNGLAAKIGDLRVNLVP